MEEIYWLDSKSVPPVAGGRIGPEQRRLVGDKAFYLSAVARTGHPIVPGFVVGALVWREFLETYDWAEPLLADLLSSRLYLNVDDPRQLQRSARHIRTCIEEAILPPSLETALSAACLSWQCPQLIFRPSPTLPHLSGLLEARLCRNEPKEIALALKQTWAEAFRARCLFYWQRREISLSDLNLAVLVQPWRSAAFKGTVQASSTNQWNSPGRAMPSFKISSCSCEQDSLISHMSEGIVSSSVPHSGKICISETELPELWKQLIEEEARSLVPELGNNFYLEWAVCPGDTVGEYPGLSVSVCSQLQLELTQVQPLAESKLMPQKQLGISTSLRAQVATYPGQKEVGILPTGDGVRGTLGGLPAAGGKAMANAFVIPEGREITEPIPPGRILVAKAISPQWLYAIGDAAGFVTEWGGMTSHAAILAREIGIPAVVGVAAATETIAPDEPLLIDGTTGEIHRMGEREMGSGGRMGRSGRMVASPSSPPSPSAPPSPSSPLAHQIATFAEPMATQLFVSLSQPKNLDRFAGLPLDGVGLLRSELMALSIVGNQHPRHWIDRPLRSEEFIAQMAAQVKEFCQAFPGQPLFYRALDWRGNEFPGDSQEANPILGLHGTFSYTQDSTLFELELAAIARLQQWGYPNIRLLLPFVRDVEEFEFCKNAVARAGINRVAGFQLWMMAEVPSVLLLLPEYIKAGVEGIAIGTNDLTQLLLAADRNQEQFATVFESPHPAVKRAIHQIIQMANTAGIPCSVCGNLCGAHPELVEDLIRWGVSAISVEPDAVERTYKAIARAEKRLLLEAARRQLP
ncbi:MAG: hypothetical protein Fur0025_40770 [Oscillatoriaceae cyanobacterium]